MKKAHTFTPKVGLSIEVDALEATPNLHESRYKASIITNGNASEVYLPAAGRGLWLLVLPGLAGH
ncbi:MAG: hypothetical protein V8S89_05870 [Oscillospiraceae bacterium]